VLLRIINNGTGSDGNDFVMDDIEIRLCAPAVQVDEPAGADTVLCAGTSVSFKGAYIDEISTVNETFFVELLKRMRVHGAKIFATTNPDRPNHWLLKKYIENPETDLKYYQFLIEENTFLPPDYVENLKKTLVGADYERFILGKWVAAENAIYRIFSDNKAKFLTSTVPEKFDRVNVGVDFGGSSSAHAFVCTGISGGNLYALQSEKLPAKGVNPAQLNRAIGDFLREIAQKFGRIDAVYCDSAEQTLINGLRAHLPQFCVKNARKKPILDRIRATSALMGLERFFILQDNCPTLENALETAMWRAKSTSDERLDDGSSDIDSLDAFEYSFENFIKLLISRYR
jgi:PBSX family phage terminase large subunit